MRKFRWWAVFGLAVNFILLLRGIAILFLEIDESKLWSLLSVFMIAIATFGIFASLKILQKKEIGFKIAKKQVWAYLIVDLSASIIAIEVRMPILIVAIWFTFASQLFKLFNSKEAREYCLSKS